MESIDEAVVICENGVHDGTDSDHSVDDYGLLDNAVDAKDSGLRGGDHRCTEDCAVRARVGEREGCALDFVDAQGVASGFASDFIEVTGDLNQCFAVAVSNWRNDESAFSIFAQADGDADVSVLIGDYVAILKA